MRNLCTQSAPLGPLPARTPQPDAPNARNAQAAARQAVHDPVHGPRRPLFKNACSAWPATAGELRSPPISRPTRLQPHWPRPTSPTVSFLPGLVHQPAAATPDRRSGLSPVTRAPSVPAAAGRPLLHGCRLPRRRTLPTPGCHPRPGDTAGCLAESMRPPAASGSPAGKSALPFPVLTPWPPGPSGVLFRVAVRRRGLTFAYGVVEVRAFVPEVEDLEETVALGCSAVEAPGGHRNCGSRDRHCRPGSRDIVVAAGAGRGLACAP